MAKGYWINLFRSIKDPAKVDAYRKLAGPVMEKSGAKFLVRGDPYKVYEHGAMMRAVVIEFESVQKAIEVHDSVESARRRRREGPADRRGRLIPEERLR